MIKQHSRSTLPSSSHTTRRRGLAALPRHRAAAALGAAALLLLGQRPTLASAVTLNSNNGQGDGFGQSSFNAGTNWPDGLAPSSGNDYIVSGTGVTLRTPADGSDYTFAGNSLTITSNGQLRYKGTGGTTITVNNLTLDGGAIDNGSTNASNFFTLAGVNMLLGSGGGTFETQGNGRQIIVSAAIGGIGALTADNNAGSGTAGIGTVILTGANTYTGGTILTDIANSAASPLTLQIGNGGTTGQLGAGGVTTNAYTTLAFDLSNAYSVSNVITGAGALMQIGTGTTTLTGANSYTGGTTVSSGHLTFVNNHSGSSSFVDNATLEFNNTAQQQLNGGTLSGTGTLIKSGSGTLLLGANGSVENVSMGAGGLIDVQGGLLRNEYSSGTWTNNKAGLEVDAGATVDLWDSPGGITVDALTGSGTVTHTSYGGTENLTVGVNNGSGTFSGTITNANGFGLNLVKAGTGTQTLSGANSYTGATTVNAGTLTIGSGSVIGGTGSNLTVANGATFKLGAGSTVNVNNINDVGTTMVLNIAGNITAAGTHELH